MMITCAGILVCDIIAANLPRISAPGEVTFAPEGARLCIGGHAANVPIDLVKLGLSGDSISTIGAVGYDIFGEIIANELGKHNIRTHISKIPNARTSVDLILVVSGEDRRFHLDVGANYYLSPDNVLPILKEEKPSIFYVGACGMLGKFDSQLSDVLQEAKKLGAVTFVDPISPYKHGWGYVIPALKWTDIIHCNKNEAMEMTRTDSIEKAIEKMLRLGARTVIVTLGESGLVAHTGDVKIRLPAFNVNAVDPTGAGDAFCAGLMHSIVRMGGKFELTTDEFIQALVMGEAAGAACVTAVGTTTAVNKENVERLLREQGERIIKSAFITRK